MNLKKVNLIIGREFLIRVRKKSFLVATFVTPLLMAALVTVPTLMATLKDSNEKRIEQDPFCRKRFACRMRN